MKSTSPMPEALTERGYWTQIMNRTGGGDVLVLGENMINHDDHAGINWWCSEAIARRYDRNKWASWGRPASGKSGALITTPARHPCPSIVRRSVFRWSMPGGGPRQETHHNTRTLNLPSRTRSGSSVSRHSAFGGGLMSLDQTPITLLFSQIDHWTVPFTTTLLRRKVAAPICSALSYRCPSCG